jgi:hypothetical protein
VTLVLTLIQPAAVLADFLYGNGLPDVALAAGVLDEGGRVAEGGEGEGGVGAGVAVGVVAAHFFFTCVSFLLGLGLVSLRLDDWGLSFVLPLGIIVMMGGWSVCLTWWLRDGCFFYGWLDLTLR